jgi:hypothetical protein
LPRLPNAPAGYRGDQDFVIPVTPAAGANASFTSAGQDWLRLVSCIATLTTDANAADRFVSLDYIDGRGTKYLRNAAPVFITASTTGQVFQWDRHRTVSEWNTDTMVFAPLASLWLPPGWTIQVTVDSKQAGDQLSAIGFLVERFYRLRPSAASDPDG